jgi:hypothetical protein
MVSPFYTRANHALVIQGSKYRTIALSSKNDPVAASVSALTHHSPDIKNARFTTAVAWAASVNADGIATCRTIACIGANSICF